MREVGIRIIVQNVFYLLLSLTPLIFFKRTSELFELNKMVFVYIVTAVVLFLWAIDVYRKNAVTIRRTAIDKPLILFLMALAISTMTSIDTRTSIFGYYGRFNGGLLSITSYAILYWGFVTFMDKAATQKAVKLLLGTATIIAIWGVTERFGLSPSCIILRGEANADCFVQDVRERVFATFGQPNWMAAWMVAIMPYAWVSLTSARLKFVNKLWYLLLSLILFSALLFTKSRSGALGLGGAYVIFWGHALRSKLEVKKTFLALASLSVLTSIIIGWPAGNLSRFARAPQTTAATSLETGGTESGTIRRIVWQGALNVWQKYPLLGSGVETFAYSYFEGRPVEHNLTSEWNFVYNKAHNEYLNYLSTTGVAGFSAYILLIGAALYTIVRESRATCYIRVATLAGYTSLLITNFFGFSVVATNLLFFLLPAFVLTQGAARKKTQLLIPPRLGALLAALAASWLLATSVRFWVADYLYASGRINEAIALSPNEATYHSAFARATVEQNPEVSYQASNRALELSPKNTNILRERALLLSQLSDKYPRHRDDTLETLNALMALAPTDPGVHYRLGLFYANAGDKQKAIESTLKALRLKPDYQNALRLLDDLDN